MSFLILLIGDHGEEFRLHSFGRKISGPFDEGRIVIIIDSSDLLPHDQPEDSVYCINHFPAAAEIPVEINPHSVLRADAVTLVFLHKQLRPGLAEAVNALLDIPDTEIILFAHQLIPAHGQKNFFLQIVAVLIFVNHHFTETGRQFRSRLRPFQNLKRVMFQVRKIKHMPGCFNGRKAFKKTAGQFDQRGNRPVACLQEKQGVIKGQTEELIQERFPNFIGFAPAVFKYFPEFRVFTRRGFLRRKPDRNKSGQQFSAAVIGCRFIRRICTVRNIRRS